MILIIGNSIDKAKTVVKEIKKISDKEIIIFKADKCLEGEAVGFSYINGKKTFFANIDKKEINLSKATAIWYWKPLLPKALRTIQPHEHQIFIYRQFMAIWRSIASILADKVWVNNHYKMLEAEHKPYQIKMASEIGFDIPDTLITSSSEKAKEFWEHCQQQMVIKTLMLSPMENSVIFTNKVTEELMLKIERLKSSPVILQKFIPKKQELRITVVGKNIFPARIISENKIDWRKSKIKAEEYTLPESIKEKCLQLVRHLGLRYGCIDMIITPRNQYIFLEINPNGQWEFIEERTGMEIGKAIAHLLI